MIGSGLKKLANEYGMAVSTGVAFGSLGGFCAALSEGPGYKEIRFSLLFRDQASRGALLDLVNHSDLKSSFRVRNVAFTARGIQVVFDDAIGTMDKIRAFLAWFLPILQQQGASPYHICTECGTPITGGRWVLTEGWVYFLHEGCAQHMARRVDFTNETRKQSDSGSYGTGLIGALLGATLGSIVWALVLMVGYVASIVGLLIGWLSGKGYDLLKGKQGKGKVVILICTVIFGVLLGTLLSDVFTLVGMINSGELEGYVLGDIPLLILDLLISSPEYLEATLSNSRLGLVFAALGVYGMIRKTGAEVADTKFQYLA